MATKKQRETYRKNRVIYRHMSAADTIRNMSDAELDRNVRKGGRDAIQEQAYRHYLAGRSMIHEPIRSVPELDEFKAAVMGEVESDLESDRRMNLIVAAFEDQDIDVGV